MAVNITGQINSSSTIANIDRKYGPYESIDKAWEKLGPDGADVCKIGLTIGIQATSASPIVEYWFKDGVTKSDLVIKAQQPTIIDGGGAPSVSSQYNGKKVEE